jgi:hypothetical protein
MKKLAIGCGVIVPMMRSVIGSVNREGNHAGLSHV